MKKYIIYLNVIILIILFFACKKKEEVPPINPFENNNAVNIIPPSLETETTFKKIYTQILKPKCANPSCHDGSFEPDYRTIESSYATLVYHATIKKTLDGKFSMRAIPSNLDSSWLYYRITTSDAQLGRMPLYSPKLSDEHINLVKNWIQEGCKDQFNQAALAPNGFPQFKWYVASDDINGLNRIDTLRSIAGQTNSPFFINNNKTLTIIARIEDDNTLEQNITNLKMKVSLQQNNFVSTNTIVSVNGIFLNNFWNKMYSFQVNTANLPKNQVLYFRIYCNDATGNADVEFPFDGMYSWWKEYCSFKVLP